MSKLSVESETDAAPQSVLGIIAASDAGSRRYKKRLRAKHVTKSTRNTTAYLRFDSWSIKLYAIDGTFFIATCKGDYVTACRARDEYLKTGRYEKSWISTNV